MSRNNLSVTASVLLSGLCLLAINASSAQSSSTIYMCRDKTGLVTVQRDACPKGSTQEKRVVDIPNVVSPTSAFSVSDLPASSKKENPDSKTEVPAAKRPDIPTPLTPEQRLPPPPIYQCATWDNNHYISENPEPKPRCVPLNVIGISGDTNNASGAVSCENKYDLCSRVPDEQHCEAWKQRQKEVESSWRYARPNEKPPLQKEFGRITKILQETTCGLDTPI